MLSIILPLDLLGTFMEIQTLVNPSASLMNTAPPPRLLAGTIGDNANNTDVFQHSLCPRHYFKHVAYAS